MMASAPVFVVLVNHNRWGDTIECLESVLRSDHPHTHVVLVDNGSSDGSIDRILAWAHGSQEHARPAGAPPDVVRLSWPPIPKPITTALVSRAARETRRSPPWPALTIIDNAQNEGFSIANNVAMRLMLASDVRGYALLINNDMVIAPSAIDALVAAIEAQRGVAAMGAVMLDYHRPNMVQIAGGGWYSRFAASRANGSGMPRGTVPEGTDLGYVGGGCLLIHVETLRHVGLFDERFFLYGEDGDWGTRMKQLGYRLSYTTAAELWHKGGVTTVNGSPFQDYHIVRAQLQYIAKHSPRLIAAGVGYWMMRALAPKLVRGQWRRAAAVLRALRHFNRSATPAG
jgi:GT2 family glycosyltransferase